MVYIMLDTQSGLLHGFDDKPFKQAAADVSYTKEEIDRMIASVLQFKGTVDTVDELPTTGNKNGYVYAVREDASEYVWLDTKWEMLGPLLDLSAYYTKAEINAMLGEIPEGRTIMDLIGTVPAGKSLYQLLVETKSELLEELTHRHTETDSFDKLPTTGNIIGDTGVVKTAVGESFTYTAYVWNGTQWAAMTGNYNAGNVLLDEDIPLAGDYTAVGNIKITDGTLPAAGKSVKQLFNEIFDKVVQPTLGDAPTAVLTISSAGQYEVGDTVSAAYFGKFNQGKYNHPWDGTKVDDGTTANTWTITFNGTTRTSTVGSGSFGYKQINDEANMKFTGTVTYNAGTVALDNKGNPSNPPVQRPEGTATLTASGSFTAFRYMYIGSVAEDVEITESVIKSLTAFKTGAVTKVLKASGGDIKLVDGAVKVIVAIPVATASSKTACGGYNLTEVKLTSASDTPITDAYQAKANVQVSGKNAGANLKDYKVWVYQPAAIDPGEVHTIKIS